MAEETTVNPTDAGMAAPTQGIEVVQATLNKFLDTAPDVNTVYGKPIQNGETTLIPTAEVLVVMGFGVGYGGGSEEQGGAAGGGGGGGGGGRTLSRPVAVVIVSPEGVRVEPVIDPTKIALAAITAVGFMLATLFRMTRPRRALRQLQSGE